VVSYQVKIFEVLPSIPPRPSKKILKKSKLFQNKDKSPIGNSNNKNRYSYTQALSSNVKEILKIKESFSNISLKKIMEIYKTVNNPGKIKPRINMTTKKLMGFDNISKVISLLSKHIFNINKTLKNIKSEILADFVYTNY